MLFSLISLLSLLEAGRPEDKLECTFCCVSRADLYSLHVLSASLNKTLLSISICKNVLRFKKYMFYSLLQLCSDSMTLMEMEFWIPA